jgi:hypothetical protein
MCVRAMQLQKRHAPAPQYEATLAKRVLAFGEQSWRAVD